MIECGAARPDAELRFATNGNLVGNWDADRLTQVISNLVVNAIQHGQGTPVTLTAVEEGDAVTVEVHNGGVPIPPAIMASIFEPLARGGKAGGLHSIGLGLFIARAIVSAHGGEIGLRSSTDQGTTFTARLPKGDSAESAASAAAIG